jgi:hypothetical protein
MQTLKIEVSNSIYEHILFFLQSLPKNLIRISYQTPCENGSSHSIKNDIEKLFKSTTIKPFSEIGDAVAWQKSMRDEWE